MSINFNSLTLVGNLTEDVTTKYLPSGSFLGLFRIAVNRKSKKNEEMIDKPLFLSVEVWDNVATNCQTYLSKGKPVLVHGRLEMEEWEKPDGEKKTKYKMTAHVVQFLGGNKNEG